MKKFIRTSTGDLTSLVQKLRCFWKHQAAEVEAIRAYNSNKINTFAMSHNIYSNVRDRVSAKALELVTDAHKAIQKTPATKRQKLQAGVARALAREAEAKAGAGAAKDLIEPQGRCPCNSLVSLGVPCSHVIFQRVKEGKKLLVTDFDHFWRKQPAPSITSRGTAPAPLEPAVVRGKGRPKGSLNRPKSTRRDLSQFEIAESLEKGAALNAGPSGAAATTESLRYLQTHGDRTSPAQSCRGHTSGLYVTCPAKALTKTSLPGS
ncbi:hypothetical protein HIM_12133 [Hirsutella minnesotensis 3608]|uniref:SWIM-type domain-containing protein n=1 Tax=Hirsutella minnesotensis 3608 TaxID=1043627 RepID=A0A0F7ZF41_9HYPO|nr:hypothetical protein HIM_12133 [Hirsutella minnesotensis 3608]